MGQVPDVQSVARTQIEADWEAGANVAPRKNMTTIMSQDSRSRALSWLTVAAIAALLWMALPLGSGLFLGALVGFSLQPIHKRLCARGMRPGFAALLCTLTTTLVVTVGALAFITLVISRGLKLADQLSSDLAPGGALSRLTDHWANLLVPLHVPPEQLTKAVKDQALALGSSATLVAGSAADATFSALLTIVFMSLAAFAVLRYWATWMRHVDGLSPLDPRHTHALFDELRRIGRQVLRGTVFTGIIQGIAAAGVYWVTGVPDPLFWGALTAFASLVPVLGTLLVWVTIGVWFLISRRFAAGACELSLSAVFIGLIPDYVIRPRLVGSEQGIPTIVTLIALFGGVAVFGLIGLVLGPVITGMAIAILRTYELEAPHREITGGP